MTDCGCKIRWDNPRKDGELFIDYCPLHQAAKELLAALQAILELRSTTKQHKLDEAVINAERAIAATKRGGA